MSKTKVSINRVFILLACCSLIILTTLSARAAYYISRPIANGQINQTYLYGEEAEDVNHNIVHHKGVDFVADTGTSVYAVADGQVMNLDEHYDNGTGTSFGNYVLIRHDQRAYVRQNNGSSVNQWGYVYSIYGHLSHNSVSVNVGDHVSAGQFIAPKKLPGRQVPAESLTWRLGGSGYARL
jgi:murein DD-endopeptidase MepM/ murein hydrolase activator NlpD